MIAWPEEVISDIARRKCVLFIGSGISQNSANAVGKRPKTWKNFLTDIVGRVKPNDHIKLLINENDFLTACELLKRELGREAFTKIVRDEYLTPGYQPAEIHSEIFKLDSRIVITPNFDKIYETYANAQAHGTIVVKYHFDRDVNSVIRESGRVILKIHGNIDSPDNLIFSRSEYAEARTKYSAFYRIVEALALTHTFIFLGCGVNDPDVKLLLEDIFFTHNSARSHLMVLPEGSLHESLIRLVGDTMNLKILTYSPVDNHINLKKSLTELNGFVETERIKIQENMNW